ncbi:MAG: hypothetical protein ACFFDN_20875 [Candidatus Hodarchaeota archaeon]
MKDRTLEKKEPTAYEIKQIILKDGTILDINKITHAALIKEKRKNNRIYFKITYCCNDSDELIALSNECCMLTYVFKFMNQHNISFEDACKLYDDMMQEAKKLKK